jgi:hypothetical protein
MILLSIFAYGGAARPGIRPLSSVTFAQAKPSCWPDHDDAAMGIFRATCEQRQPRIDRGKIFSFLDLPSGAYPRDVRWFLIPNH